jgi:hypothetical protein
MARDLTHSATQTDDIGIIGGGYPKKTHRICTNPMDHPGRGCGSGPPDPLASYASEFESCSGVAYCGTDDNIVHFLYCDKLRNMISHAKFCVPHLYVRFKVLNCTISCRQSPTLRHYAQSKHSGLKLRSCQSHEVYYRQLNKLI